MSDPQPHMALPPKNIEDLTAFIEQGGKAVLGKRAHSTLVKMLQEPHMTAVQSISEIAANNNVDPSTLTRLGKRLGFQGFTGLQDLFRNSVVRRTNYYSSRTLSVISKGDEGTGGFTRDLAEEEIKNIYDTIHATSDTDIDRSADIIVNARRVYVLGLRSSFAFAHFFSYHLGFMGREVTLLGGAGFTIAEDLVHLSPDDVLVVISFRPYASVSVNAANWAMSRSLPIVAITDLGSPYSQAAGKGVVLAVPSAVYFTQSLSSLFLVELLLARIAKKLGQDAVSAIEDLEAHIRLLDIERE